MPSPYGTSSASSRQAQTTIPSVIQVLGPETEWKDWHRKWIICDGLEPSISSLWGNNPAQNRQLTAYRAKALSSARTITVVDEITGERKHRGIPRARADPSEDHLATVLAQVPNILWPRETRKTLFTVGVGSTSSAEEHRDFTLFFLTETLTQATVSSENDHLKPAALTMTEVIHDASAYLRRRDTVGSRRYDYMIIGDRATGQRICELRFLEWVDSNSLDDPHDYTVITDYEKDFAIPIQP